MTLCKGKPEYIVALVGNPNVGKSTVFNALTGLRQHTGNWAGKTVTAASGNYSFAGQSYKAIDLPGIYSLEAISADEEAARQFLLSEDVDAVVVVADATALERNLSLVLQILTLKIPVVVCLNLLDEARKKRIKIDIDKLSEQLGVPVVGTNARKGRGLEQLKKKVAGVCTDGGTLEQDLQGPASDAKQRYALVEQICARCLVFGKKDYTNFDRRLDHFFMGKWTAVPIMLLLLALVFWITIAGANYPSSMLSVLFINLEAAAKPLLLDIGLPTALVSLLTEGLLRTLGWVIAVMLPPMAIFFPLFTLLEDSGYLPRVAFNLDNCFKRACACGKQSLTMCMGFGCNACGVIGCRIIQSPREKLIAMLTNSFVPCNGRFPTLIAIISMFCVTAFSGICRSLLAGLLLTALVVFAVLMTLIISKILSKTLLKGLPSSVTLELPPYRKPQIGTVVVRSLLDRTIFVLARAVKVAAPAGVLIWLLANISVGEGVSLLAVLTDFFSPLGRFLGLDGAILLAFILAFPANEIFLPLVIMNYLQLGGIVEIENLTTLRDLLVANGWTGLTALCTMVFCLLHFPCGTTVLTIKKETGSLKWALISIIIPLITGCVVCAVINGVGRLII